MFEDSRKRIEDEYNFIISSTKGKYELLKSKKGIRSYLNELIVARDRLADTVRDYTYSIEQLQEKQKYLPGDVSWELKESGRATRILLKNLKAALGTNPEFNHRFFKTGLKLACENPETILLVTGMGARDSEIHVIINLDATAGSIADWAGAVKAVREEINSTPLPNGRPRNITGPEMASRFWKEKFYAPARERKRVVRRKWNRKTKEYDEKDVTSEQIAKYWDTMNRRLSASGKLAPYWELIDKGVAMMGGDGSAYPVAQPTYFVETTITEIRKVFRQIFLKRKRVITTEIGKLREDKKLIVEEYNRVKEDVKEYEKMAIREEITPDVAFYARVKGEVERTGRSYSVAKMEKILTALKAGDISGLSITAENRIEITEKGGRRFRIGISRIISEFGL